MTEGDEMGQWSDRLRAVLHLPRKAKTPAEQHQETRWENEGGALHPDEHPDRPPDR